MKVLVTGATGMVGGGVLRECLLDPDVTEVITLGRRPAHEGNGPQSPKLRQIVHADLLNLAPTKTAWYNALYAVFAPFYPLWKRLFPNFVTTTECIGRAMLHVTKRGWPRRVMEVADINAACATG